MTHSFIFAHDVIFDPETAKVVAVVGNGGVWRDGVRIAVLVGAQMYDLNGNLLGKLGSGAGSVPISFKNLVEANRPTPSLRQSRSYPPRDNRAPQGEVDRP